LTVTYKKWGDVSKIIYYYRNKYIDPSIKLHPIKLKGRGVRFEEDY
jgi:hypothetical protein